MARRPRHRGQIPDPRPRHQVHQAVRRLLERGRGACIRIPPKAPQANAFCESFIGTCKHQCLNHFVCFGLGQLAHINRVWIDYYHTQRPTRAPATTSSPPISGAHPQARSNGRSGSVASSPGTSGKRRKPHFLYVTSAPVFRKAGLFPAMISDGGSVPENGIE